MSITVIAIIGAVAVVRYDDGVFGILDADTSRFICAYATEAMAAANATLA